VFVHQDADSRRKLQEIAFCDYPHKRLSVSEDAMTLDEARNIINNANSHTCEEIRQASKIILMSSSKVSKKEVGKATHLSSVVGW